jgi:acyl-coenzyme A thioesterase PaaI-like protein
MTAAKGNGPPEADSSSAGGICIDDVPSGAIGAHPGYVQHLPIGADGRGGLEFGPLLEAMRLLQDRFVGAAMPAEMQVQLRTQITSIADTLRAYRVEEARRVDGRRPDLPGRGSLLMVPWEIEEQTSTALRGRAMFRRFHLGGNAAAHGGALPLLFDDILGKTANHQQPGIARTVNLTVDFRRITPLGEQLPFEASLDRVDGRKRWASARISNNAGDLLAEARALFLALKPGQQ